MLLHCFSLLFITSDATGATSGLPDNQPYSFESIGTHAFALLFIASDATGATSGLPDNQPYPFASIGTHASALLFIASDATGDTSGLPRGYLTTSPIQLKKVVLRANYYEYK